MTIPTNRELACEIGDGLYYHVIGEPEIDDTLGTHGDTANITIHCPPGGPYPKLGSIVILTRGGEVEFGGRFLDRSTKFEPTRFVYTIPIANFIDYTQRKVIRKYAEDNTLKGHIEEACRRAGADSGRNLKLIKVEVLGDSAGEIFHHEFPRGKLEAFLDDLTGKRNAKWTLRYCGSTTIHALRLTTGGIANLFVTINGSGHDMAPKPVLRRTRVGETRCSSEIFWRDITEQEAIQSASVFRAIGLNGLNRPDGDTGEVLPDSLEFKAKDGQTFYDLNITAKQIDSIKVVTPDMVTKFLKKRPFKLDQPVPPDGSNEARIRVEEKKFYVSPVDVPKDSIVTVYHSTVYVFYEKINQAAVDAIKEGDLDASDGIVEDEIVDEAIVDIAGAMARADAAEAAKAKRPVTVSFGTYVKGWRSGMQFQYINPNTQIDEILMVTGAPKTLKKGKKTFTKITSSNVQFMSSAEIEQSLLDKVNNPQSPRLPQYTIDPLDPVE